MVGCGEGVPSAVANIAEALMLVHAPLLMWTRVVCVCVHVVGFLCPGVVKAALAHNVDVPSVQIAGVTYLVDLVEQLDTVSVAISSVSPTLQLAVAVHRQSIRTCPPT